MTQKFIYIWHHPHIIGPFSRSEVITLLHNLTVQATDMASTDKQLWQPLTELLQLPEEPAVSTTESAVPASVRTEEYAPATSAPAPADSRPAAADRIPFIKLLSHAVSVPLTGSSLSLKSHRMGRQNMLMTGMLCMLISLLTATLGCVLFAANYPEPKALYAGTLIWILVSGSGGWLLNWLIKIFTAMLPLPAAAETNFLCAMGCMLNTAWLSVLLNGSCFVLDNERFACSLLQQIIICGSAALAGSIILANTLQMLRINLMRNSQLQPDTATAWAVMMIWIIVLLPAIILQKMYLKIF